MPLQLNVHRVLIAITLALVINMVPAQAEGQTKNALREEMVSIMADQDNRVRAERFSNFDIEAEQPNLYLTLYNEIILEADLNAKRTVASRSNTTRTGVEQALNTANNDQQDLVEAYEAERKFYEMLAAHENETLALEIFANGSTRDASFDLLKDLERIEKILFGENYGSQYDLSNSDNGGRRQSIGSLFQQATTVRNGSNTSQTASTPEDQPIIINPEVCQLDDDLVSNLNEYYSEFANPDTEDDPAPIGDSGSNIGDRKALNPLEPNNESCTDIFCLRVERIYATRTSYFPVDDTCIACTVEDIATITDELIAESLVPRKVTGNFGEPNICKESYSKNILSMRISLLKRPIVPETNVAFRQATELSPEGVQNQNRELSATNVDSSRNLVDQTIQGRTSLGDIDQASISNVASEAEYQNQIEKQLRSNLLAVVEDINSNAALADALATRMQNMTIYFESYQEMLTEIQTILNDVTQKDAC